MTKQSWLTGILAVVCVSMAFVVLNSGTAPSGRQGSTDESADSNRFAKRLSALEGNLDRVFRRLESIETAMRRREQGSPGGFEPADVTGADAVRSRADRFRSASFRTSRSAGGSTAPRRLQEDMARLATAYGPKTPATPEEKERQERLSKGPYGRYNLVVNSLAEELDLDSSQKERYHKTLQDHFARRDELRQGTDWRDPSQRTEYRVQVERLERDFNDEVVGFLRSGQAQQYERLKGWHRRPFGALGVKRSSTAPALITK